MEPMDGEQGLEVDRSTVPSSAGQSSDIHADKPWTFPLQSNPEENRDKNPKLDVKFDTLVELHALKLQGNTDKAQTTRMILSVLDEATQTFKDVLDSSGKPLVSLDSITCLLIPKLALHSRCILISIRKIISKISVLHFSSLVWISRQILTSRNLQVQINSLFNITSSYPDYRGDPERSKTCDSDLAHSSDRYQATSSRGFVN